MAKHGRGRSRDTAVVDPLPLTLRDIYLLTAESDGQLALPGLGLVIDGQGLTVFAPHGATAAALTWSELTVLRAAGRTTGPGGEDAVILEARSEQRTHRFVVPTDDAEAFEATIGVITGVPGTELPRRTRRRR
jgi:hypothetical protein